MKQVELERIFDGLSDKERFRRYRKIWRQARDYRLLTDFPLHLDIELSGICNLRCEHCFQNGMITGDLGLMDWDLYRRIIDEGAIKGLCAVKLQVRGESMLHPRFFDAITYAKNAGILDVQVTTNATLLDTQSVEAILDSGLDGIIFSLDQQHRRSYGSRHHQIDYDHIESAVGQLLKRRRKRNVSRPWVRLQTAVACLDNNKLEQTKTDLRQRFADADIIAVNRIQNFKQEADVYPDLHTSYRLMPCDYLMHRLAIFWNGEVTVCCVDYNNRFQLGTLPEQTIASIWRSTTMMQLRKRHRDGQRKDLALCGRCHACSEPVGSKTADTIERHGADSNPQRAGTKDKGTSA